MAAADRSKEFADREGGGSGVLTLNLAALKHNYQILRQAAAGAEVAAVVKADAYGLGAAAVAPVLYQAGCRLFFVAQYDEAMPLQRILRRAAAARRPAKPAEIAILNDVLPHEAWACARAGFIPVLNSLESVRLWAQISAARKNAPQIMLQCDSGMARLGLDETELRALKSAPELAAQLNVKAILSHLACNDEEQGAMNAVQSARFAAAVRILAEAVKRGSKRRAPRENAPRLSLAASDGLALGSDYRLDIVRPGLALYGILDGAGKQAAFAAKLRPVMGLSARVLRVGALQKGDTVGYGATYRAARAMPIAAISAGYADGWPRRLSNQGAVYYQGARLPIIGRISMDCMTVSLAPLVKAGLPLPERGAAVELIGAYQSLAQVAQDAGMIPYEILTGLGKRWQKRFISR